MRAIRLTRSHSGQYELRVHCIEREDRQSRVLLAFEDTSAAPWTTCLVFTLTVAEALELAHQCSAVSVRVGPAAGDPLPFDDPYAAEVEAAQAKPPIP